jgi:hypothetical protein
LLGVLLELCQRRCQQLNIVFRGARRIRKKSYANIASVPTTPDCSLLIGYSVSRLKR